MIEYNNLNRNRILKA